MRNSMNLDKLINKHLNEQLKDSKLKKAKEFVKRYYPEIVAPVYFGLETLLMHNLNSFVHLAQPTYVIKRASMQPYLN